MCNNFICELLCIYVMGITFGNKRLAFYTIEQYNSASNGVIAQLVERLNGIQKVGGSIPPGSTITKFIVERVIHVRSNFSNQSIT